MKIKLGITGGIGSGKSYICQRLQKAGIPIYSCDDQAKRLNVESPEIRKAFTALLGPSVYLEDGSLNKPLLINYLFASEEHANTINHIVHPVVLQDFLQWAQEQEEETVALEAALLFEAGYQQQLDCTIVVTAPLELRLQRIIERDHTTREAALQRIGVQSSDEKIIQQADFVIVNDEKTSINKQIQELFVFLRSNSWKHR